MNYKCIEDSDWVEFEQDLTRFVGANEAGKTSFLEAVSNYKSNDEVDDEVVCRHTNRSNYSKSSIPISAIDIFENPIRIHSINDYDPDIIESADRLLSKRAIFVRYADGRIESRKDFDMNKKRKTIQDVQSEEGLRSSQNSTIPPVLEEVIPEMVRRYRNSNSKKKLIKKTYSGLQSLKSDSVQGRLSDPERAMESEFIRRIANIPKVTKSLEAELERLPDISIYKNIDQVPNNWTYSGSTSSASDSPYSSVVQFGSEGDRSTSEFVTDRKEAEESISEVFNSSWPGPDVNFTIRIETNLVTFAIESESRNGVITVPGERSEGFRWFLSFCIQVLFSDTEEDILLLDDPGDGLHPEANKKVRDVLENFAEDTQTAYSTHSPYMLDTSDLDSIRLVQRENSETTEIVNDLSEVETDSPDALAPVRARLGANYADSLFASNQNVIVEGFTDRKYLEAFSEFLGDGEPVLPEQLSITDASGGGNIETLAKMVIAEGYDYAILLDDDRGGRSSKENLLDAGISEENVVMVSDAHDDEESSNDTVEDLLDDDMAIEALAQMHDSFGEDDLRGEIDGREHFPKRVVSRLRELDGRGELDDPPTEMDRLAKGGMAEYVTRKVETGQWDESELGAETVERFESLLSEVVAVLESNGE